MTIAPAPVSRGLWSTSVRRRTAFGLILRAGVVCVGFLATAGCNSGYQEKVIVAKEIAPLERARQMLQRYAEGQPVGSDFMGFTLLEEEIAKTNPDQAGPIGDALAAIEKAMLRPAEVKAIARRALADLDKTAPAR